MSLTLRKQGARYSTTFCIFAGLSSDTKPVGVYQVSVLQMVQELLKWKLVPRIYIMQKINYG
mgnify:CR=1 FL=1